jgi:TonB-linked SusC/RagA family outer membrane protein
LVYQKTDHMKKIVSTILVAMLCFSIGATAQIRTVTGKVTDEKGAPIPSASVVVKGKNTGVAADANGDFKVSAQTGDILTISSVNFQSKDVKVGSGSSLNVTLASESSISEVVVTALGIRRKPKEIGYATTTVKPEQITAGHSPNLGQALSGKVSGLTVSNTSASVNATPRIVLRGLRSITGDNTALVVLDGVPVPANTINYINPNDVERIDVMKGGQAATLFGSDGVNGAIVITTKKGSRKPELTLSVTTNTETVSYLPKSQHGFGSGSAYGANQEENFHAAENQQYGPAYDGSMRAAGRVVSDGSTQTYAYSDIPNIRRDMWHKGFTNQADFSYRSGDETGSFFASYQNLHSEGIVPGDKYDRNVIRMNSSRTYGRLKFSFDATYSFDKANRTNANFYSTSLQAASWLPLTDPNFKDWRNNKFADPSGYYNDYYNNPWWELDNNRFLTRNNYFNGNITLEYKVNNNLSLTFRGAAATTNSFQIITAQVYTYSAWSKTNAYSNNFNLNYDTYLTGRGKNTARNTPINGSYNDNANYGNRINSDVFANYSKDFKDVSLKVIAGNNIQVRTANNLATGTTSIAIPGLFNVNNSQNGILTGNNGRSETRKVGFYADATFGYKNYLFVHGTYRYDMSSVFYAPGRASNLYSFGYPGVDVSLVLSDVFPSIKSKNFNYLKLRAGINRNGNDNLAAYQLNTLYTSNTGFPFSGLLGTTVGNTTVNKDLRAEIVNTSEIGFEAAFWDSRINIEGSYYRQKSVGQILDVSISTASGFSNYLLNAADVTNQGYEMDVRMQVVKGREWQVNANANFSYNFNKVNSLYASNGLNSLIYQSNTQYTINAEVGQPFPYLKTTAWTRDPNGRVVIDPANGWPVKASGTTGQGGTTPKYVFGAGFNVAYKGFTFQANAEYRGGHVVYNSLGETTTFTGASALTTLNNRQQFLWPNSSYPDGTGKYTANTGANAIAIDNWHAIYAGTGDISDGNSFPNVGEMFFSSGSFWKLRDVSLGYELPASVMKSLKGIKGISIGVWGRNLVTMIASDNYFMDPELSNTAGNSQGVSNTLNTPATRQIGGTIKITF